MKKFWAGACAPREEVNAETGIPMHREIPSQVGPKGSCWSLWKSGKTGIWRAVGKASACNVGDPGSIPGSGRFLWRREWQSTPIFLLRKSHRQRSLESYSSWGRKQPDTSERLTLISYIFPQAALSIPKALKGFPGGSDGKESACNARDLGLIPGLGRSAEEGHGHPL